TKHGTFKSRSPIDAADTREFADGIQAWNWPAVFVEHLTGQIHGHATQAFAREWNELHRIEWRRLDPHRPLGAGRVEAMEIGVVALVNQIVPMPNGSRQRRGGQP